MAKTLTLNAVSENISWDYENVGYPKNTVDIGSVTYTGPQLQTGVAAGQADVKYSVQLSIAASGTTTIDLATLVDSFGSNISFVRIKYLYIENSALGKASAIAVGNAGSNPFSGIWSPGTATISIRNGAKFSVGVAQDATGYVVGSGVNILITNDDSVNAATVNVVIVGCDS